MIQFDENNITAHKALLLFFLSLFAIKYCCKIIIMNETEQAKSSQVEGGIVFKKGITLSDYLKDMPTEPIDHDKSSSSENELYIDCGMGRQLNTFAINQIDEDNYDEEDHITPSFQQVTYNIKEVVNKKNEFINPFYNRIQKQESEWQKQQGTVSNKSNPKQFNTKKHSNSPQIEILNQSPLKDSLHKNESMLRSMYGGKSRQTGRKSGMILSSTICNNFWKGHKSKSTVKKQIEIKQKNKKLYNELIKYEKNVKNKYNKKLDLIGMRVQGLKDKLCERQLKRNNRFAKV